MQTITLKGYGTNIPPYEAIELGTYDSYGVEQLQIVPSHGWENLSIIASFFPPSGAEPIKVAVLSSGIIDVPPEATAKQSGKGIIVFAGYKANTQLISTNVAYNIRDHKDIASGDPVCPTPSVVDQIVNAAKAAQEDAEKAAGSAKKAEDVAASVRNDADEGKFNGEDGYSPSAGVTQLENGAIISIRDKTGESTANVYNGRDGAKGDKGDTGTTPQLKIGEDNLWHVSYDNGETWVSLGVKATGDTGAQGEKGDKGDTGAAGKDGLTPHIGENGNWWVGDTDTGVSAKVPEDYPQIKKDVSQLKEDTAALQKRQNVLVGSETGNPVSCDDSFAAPLCGLTVYGKSTQDGTPTPDAPVPIVSAGDSGSLAVKVTGKNLFYEQEFQNYFINSVANTVGLSVGNVSCVLQVITGAKYYVTRNKIGTKFRVAVVDKLPTSGNPVTPSSGINADSKRQVEISATSKYMVIQCEDEAAFSGLMVSLDSSTTYSPYHEQLLTLPTPNGLPGIPVTSGGNYTDPQGQQWVCDEVDLERGVKVQRVKRVDISSLDKSYWDFRSDTGANTSSTRYKNNAVMIDFKSNAPAMSNILPVGVTNIKNTFRLVATPLYLYQFNLDSSEFPTLNHGLNTWKPILCSLYMLPSFPLRRRSRMLKLPLTKR